MGQQRPWGGDEAHSGGRTVLLPWRLWNHLRCIRNKRCVENVHVHLLRPDHIGQQKGGWCRPYHANPDSNLFQIPPFFCVHLYIYTVLVPCPLWVCLFPHVSPVIPRLFPGARLFPIWLICSTFLFNNSVFLDSSRCLYVAYFFRFWNVVISIKHSFFCLPLFASNMKDHNYNDDDSCKTISLGLLWCNLINDRNREPIKIHLNWEGVSFTTY